MRGRDHGAFGASQHKRQRSDMAMKLVSVFLVTMMLSTTLAAGLARAACDDRPGTPDNVKAAPLSTTDIQVSWRNRATERVWWDVEMKDEKGKVLPLPAGIGRGDRGFNLPISNVYSAPQSTKGTTRCFRVRARTGPRTEGCVSAQWSAMVCAATTPSGIIDRPKIPIPPIPGR